MTNTGCTTELRAAWYAEYWRRFNDRRWDELSRCYAAEATSTWIGEPPQSSGPGPILGRGLRRYATAFSDGRGEPQLTLVSGSRVAAAVLFRGRHSADFEGPMGAISATGRAVGLLALHTAELDGSGQIAREWWVLDQSLLMAQLGLNPATARGVIDASWPARPVVVATGDAVEHTNASLTERIYALFRRKDPAMFALFAEDIVEVVPSNPEDTIGREALAEMNRAFWSGFSDIHVDIEHLFAAGNYTVMLAHLRGTNDGEMPLFGLRGSGRTIDIEFAEIAKWEDDRIKTAWSFANNVQLAAQLGLAPP